jgi:hypothetical protein
MSLQIGGHILYVRQERDNSKKNKPLRPVSYEAILLGQDAPAEEGAVGNARLIFFHPDKAAHLNSSDWHQAFEYAEQVPYQPDGEFFHAYTDAESKFENRIHSLESVNDNLRQQIAQLKAKPSPDSTGGQA